MKKIANQTKISYEPEADVLSWEITNKPIDFAQKIGNMVVHFTKNNIPVLVEILEASSFFTKAKDSIEQRKVITFQMPSLVRQYHTLID